MTIIQGLSWESPEIWGPNNHIICQPAAVNFTAVSSLWSWSQCPDQNGRVLALRRSQVWEKPEEAGDPGISFCPLHSSKAPSKEKEWKKGWFPKTVNSEKSGPTSCYIALQDGSSASLPWGIMMCVCIGMVAYAYLQGCWDIKGRTQQTPIAWFPHFPYFLGDFPLGGGGGGILCPSISTEEKKPCVCNITQSPGCLSKFCWIHAETKSFLTISSLN